MCPVKRYSFQADGPDYPGRPTLLSLRPADDGEWINVEELASWIRDCWEAEVENQLASNAYRRVLDKIWRQIYRHLTGKEMTIE